MLSSMKDQLAFSYWDDYCLCLNQRQLNYVNATCIARRQLLLHLQFISKEAHYIGSLIPPFGKTSNRDISNFYCNINCNYYMNSLLKDSIINIKKNNKTKTVHVP